MKFLVGGGKKGISHLLNNRVPKNKDLLQQYGHTLSTRPITTLMIRNVPNRYTQKQFVQELDQCGFQACYDFVYLPVDQSTESNVGYAFVNFCDATHAVRALSLFSEYRFLRYRHVTSKIGIGCTIQVVFRCTFCSEMDM